MSVAGLNYVKAMNALYERRPFILTEGSAGLVQAHSQSEDWISIILGANIPLILREDASWAIPANRTGKCS